MIPQSIGAVLAFLLFVVPGLIYERLRAKRKPETERTTFREISSTALAGSIFSGLSIGLLSASRWRWPDWTLDVGAWLRDSGDTYLDSHYRLIARTVLAEVLVAVGLALLVYVVPIAVNRRWLRTKISEHSAWHQHLRLDAASDERTYMSIEVESGAVWSGYLRSYTTGAVPNDEREIVLGEPITLQRSRRKQAGTPSEERPGTREGTEDPGTDAGLARKAAAPGAARVTELDSEWRHVILPGSQIRHIAVSYVKRPTDDEGGRVSHLRRIPRWLSARGAVRRFASGSAARGHVKVPTGGEHEVGGSAQPNRNPTVA